MMKLPHMIVAVLLLPAGVCAAGQPMPVSPGSPTGFAAVQTLCPTFSWAAVSEATAHELVVYQVGESGPADLEPIAHVSLPGSAGSWTPSLEFCLQPARAYAWSVRATDGETLGPWSEASLFRVVPRPTIEDVEEALVVLQTFMRSRPSGSREAVDTPARFPIAAEFPTEVRGLSSSETDLLAAALDPFGATAMRAELSDLPVSGEGMVSVHGIIPGLTGANFQVGVLGEITGSLGEQQIGVYGSINNDSSSSAGVFGISNSTSGDGVGVYGESKSAAGAGGWFSNINGLALVTEGPSYLEGDVEMTGLLTVGGDVEVDGQLTLGGLCSANGPTDLLFVDTTNQQIDIDASLGHFDMDTGLQECPAGGVVVGVSLKRVSAEQLGIQVKCTAPDEATVCPPAPEP